MKWNGIRHRYAHFYWRWLGRTVSVYTIWAKVRCASFLSTGTGVRIDRGLRIRPYGPNVETFSVVLADNVLVGRNSTFQGSGQIEIGERTRCRSHCLIDASGRVTIGSDVGIADFVSIRDSDHRFEDRWRNIRSQGLKTEDVCIGSDVWIGHGAIILRGVEIGNGAVVGAGSVVTKNVPENSIFVGNPARCVGQRSEGHR